MSMLDLLIIGAGPAGMRAAIESRARGLSVAVADEAPGAGGQVYRGAAKGPLSGAVELGSEYAAGRRLAAAFEASGAGRHFGTTVVMVEQGQDGIFSAGLAAGRGPVLSLRAQSLIVATGALERPMPIPGWTLPGVMTAGAAQTLLKSSAVAPEGPVVMAGMGPLLYLLASQYARLGVKVEALLDTTPATNLSRAARHLPGFLASPYVRKGIHLLTHVARTTQVHRNVTEVRAGGDGRLDTVTFTSGGRMLVLPANVLLLHQGVVPQVNLAMAMGVKHIWNDLRRAFEPERDALCESTVPGLFIAGDSGGIGGAEVAEIEGAIAAHGVLARLGQERSGDTATLAGLQRQRRVRLRGRAFLDALYRPSGMQVSPADDVIVCRCEEITAGDIRDAVRLGARGPNQAKAFTRAGMGPCQARMCGLTVNAVIAAETGLDPAVVGHMRLRMPVKPVTVGQMAGLAGDGDTG